MLSKSLAEIVDDALRLINDETANKYKCPCPSTACSEKSKKCVHFSKAPLMEVSETISRLDMTQDEIGSYWWTSAEQEQIWRKADSLVAFTRRQRKGFVCDTLARAFEIVSSIVDRSISGDLSKHHHWSSEGAARRTLAWVENCNARRGLEQYINNHPKSKKIISDHRRAVILCAVPHGSDRERVRYVSRKFSAVSASLAHLMGKADERFVTQGLNLDLEKAENMAFGASPSFFL
jgi:hypothetical protein